jgi:hypothetical protein
VTDTRIPPTEPGAALLRAGRFFRPGTPAPGLRSIGLTGGREADAFCRDRWSHDRVVNSTHGEIEAMYRLPAIARYEDRYVIPTAAVGDARRLEESALPDGCSLDDEGGPGMGGDGPFGQGSGRKLLPLVSVENFHALRRRQTADHRDDPKET